MGSLQYLAAALPFALSILFRVSLVTNPLSSPSPFCHATSGMLPGIGSMLMLRVALQVVCL